MPPDAWNDQRKPQYKAAKKNLEQQDRSEELVQAIAARTVQEKRKEMNQRQS